MNKRMTALFSLLLLSTAGGPHARAAGPECSPSRTVSGATGPIKLCYEAKRGEYVSESCLTGKCDIMQMAQKTVKAPAKLSMSDLSGGKNPHSMACSKAGGDVRILKDSDGDEQSYCQSKKDKSIASTSIFMWTSAD